MKIGVFLGNKQAAWLAAFQNEAKEYARKTGVRVEVEAMDFERLPEQGFSLVLHKMCSQIALYDTDPASRHALDKLQEYLTAHPEKSFESLAAVRDINCRKTVAEKLASFRVERGKVAVLHPPFLVVSSHQEAASLAAQMKSGEKKLPFALPWVCKPLVADGVPESHNLGMITAPEGLSEAPEVPFLVEPFVNHGGEIVKVYVLGDTMLQLRRPSLPDVLPGNFPAVDGPFYAPFGRISNPNALPSDAKVRALPEDESERVAVLDDQLLEATVSELKHRLGVQLFGVDLIRDSQTGDYLIIDINFCPGYYGVSNVFEKLLDLFRARLKL